MAILLFNSFSKTVHCFRADRYAEKDEMENYLTYRKQNLAFSHMRGRGLKTHTVVGNLMCMMFSSIRPQKSEKQRLLLLFFFFLSEMNSSRVFLFIFHPPPRRKRRVMWKWVSVRPSIRP